MGLVDTIADLIRQQGHATAEGQRQSGLIWGNAISNIGQQVASIPAQMQQAKAMEATAKLRDLQMQSAQLDLQKQQRDAKSLQVFESALKDPQNWNPDGSVNSDAITQTLRSQDVGAWQHWNAITQATEDHDLDRRKKLSEIAASDQTQAEKARAAQKLQRDGLGQMAFAGEQLLNQQPNDPLHARDTTLATVARAASQGLITADQAKDFLLQTAQASPEQMRQVFGQFVPADLRSSLEKTAADTAAKQAEAAKNLAEAGKFSREPAERPAEAVVPVIGPNGKPIYATRSAAVGQAVPPPARVLYPAPAAGGAGEGLTPDAVVDMGTAYRLIGPSAIPTRIAGSERVKVINEAAKQTRALGQTPVESAMKRLTTKADSAALTQLTKMADSAAAYENKASAQADIIRDLSKKVPRTTIPKINEWIQSGRETFTGDENATKLANAIQTFSTEYAKIMEGSTGSAAASHDSSRAAANRLINTGMSQGTMAGVLDLMQQEMGLTMRGYDVAKDHITSRIGGVPSVAPPGDGDPLGLFGKK